MKSFPKILLFSQHSVLFIVLALLSPIHTLSAKDLGSFGTTYPILEPDALKEIETRAGEVDWGKTFNKEKYEKIIKSYRPDNLQKLPRAERTKTFFVNMTYTLKMNIPDGNGGTLYPKGYAFNPLDHVFVPKIIIILNGNDSEQVEWFKSSEFAEDIKVTLLLTEGPYFELSERLKRPVFYANQKIIDRFQLKAVPSVVIQKRSVMEVEEIAF